MERIKNTPSPNGFRFFPNLFTRVFCVSLPIASVESLGLATPIGSTLIGLVFLAVSSIGEDSTDPFANSVHDVPLTAMCRTIEIDLLQTAESPAPEPSTPDHGVSCEPAEPAHDKRSTPRSIAQRIMYCDDGTRADVDFIDDGLKMAVTWSPKGRTEISRAQRTGDEFRGDQSRAIVAGGAIAFMRRGKIHDMQALLYTLAPVSAVVIGAIVASRTKLKPSLVAGLQHLAAGVVFAAAATEILPQVKHEASPSATSIGGAAGVATMSGLKAFEARFKGPTASLAAIGIDILVDGSVLGLAFVAGEKAGFSSTIASTLEVSFSGSTSTNESA
ncbi:hypothetical protein OY671_007878, partial [Metschnikowia pulcherrima]